MATKKAAKKSTAKKSTAKKSVAKKAVAKRSARKYSPAAGKSVEREMKRFNEGKARSGAGGKGGAVKSRKQAIAIGLSEARAAGKKVPKKKS